MGLFNQKPETKKATTTMFKELGTSTMKYLNLSKTEYRKVLQAELEKATGAIVTLADIEILLRAVESATNEVVKSATNETNASGIKVKVFGFVPLSVQKKVTSRKDMSILRELQDPDLTDEDRESLKTALKNSVATTSSVVVESKFKIGEDGLTPYDKQLEQGKRLRKSKTEVVEEVCHKKPAPAPTEDVTTEDVCEDNYDDDDIFED